MASRGRPFEDPLFHNDSPNDHPESANNVDQESYSDSEDSYDDVVRPGEKIIKRQVSRSSYQSKIEDLNRPSRQPNNEEEPGKDQVLKRNRKSAKECRERKKIYIHLLEKKVEDLRKEIESSKQLIRTDYNFVCKVLADVDSERMKFVTGKLELEKKLAAELLKSQADESSQMLLETYLYKFDINGRNKTELLNGQFDGLARMLLDHRLLTFWDANLAEFGAGLFDVLGSNNSNSYDRAASLLQQRRIEILNILKNLRDIKEQIKDEGDRIQYLTGELAKNLGWRQIIRFLLHPLYLINESSEQLKEQSGTSIEETVRKRPKV